MVPRSSSRRSAATQTVLDRPDLPALDEYLDSLEDDERAAAMVRMAAMNDADFRSLGVSAGPAGDVANQHAGLRVSFDDHRKRPHRAHLPSRRYDDFPRRATRTPAARLALPVLHACTPPRRDRSPHR